MPEPPPEPPEDVEEPEPPEPPPPPPPAELEEEVPPEELAPDEPPFDEEDDEEAPGVASDFLDDPSELPFEADAPLALDALDALEPSFAADLADGFADE